VSSESLVAAAPLLPLAVLPGVVVDVVEAPSAGRAGLAVLGGALGAAAAGSPASGAGAESAGGEAELAPGEASAANTGRATQLEIDTAKLSPIARDDEIISTLNGTISSEIEPIVQQMTQAGAEKRFALPALAVRV